MLPESVENGIETAFFCRLALPRKTSKPSFSFCASRHTKAPQKEMSTASWRLLSIFLRFAAAVAVAAVVVVVAAAAFC